MRSTPGRLLRGALGIALVAYGATHASLVGLVLMMLGVVPLVTALAGICLLEEVIRAVQGHPAQAGRPHKREA